MKRLTISKLMDEYTDTEFFPTGGSVADPEAVKGWVLANAKAPVKKKQAPKKRRTLLAAALAAVLLLLVGAGLPYMEHRLASGKLSFEQRSDGRITALVHYGSILHLENDRILFAPNEEERIDITDLISEETPYLYDGSDPETGSTYYLIMGGTPEGYGYLEWISAPDPFDYSNDPLAAASAVFDESGRRIRTVYSFDFFTRDEKGEGHNSGFSGFDFDVVQLFEGMDHPWLVAGLTQLGIPYECVPETLEN